MSSLLHALRPLLLDLLSTIIFVALWSLTENLILATGVAVAVGVGQIVFAKLTGKRVDLMQWMALGLVIVFGGATLLTHDPRFIMVKPTLIYAAIGAVMLKPGWLERYMPPRADGLIPHSAMVVAGYAWSALMFGTAIANIVIALNFGEAAWRSFIAYFPTISKFVLFAITYLGLRGIAVRNKRAQDAAAQQAAATATP